MKIIFSHDIFQKPPIFYQRMYDALNLLVQFFNANDKGLPMQQILNPMYQVNGLVIINACTCRSEKNLIRAKLLKIKTPQLMF